MQMAQGKEWNKDEVIAVLEQYFKLGCNVAKACDYAGIPRTTVQTWIENDELLRLKVTGWQNEMNVLARNNWKAKMNEGDFDASKEWIRRKEKDEFSERSEVSGPNGEALVFTVVKYGEKEHTDTVPVQS
jgi:hypothetical protein